MSWKIIASIVITLATALSDGSPAAGRATDNNTDTDKIVAPAVPSDLTPPAGYKPFRVAHAIGTQNYICAPAATASGVEWLFVGPQATLFDEDGGQVLTHFQSKNPYKANAIQATWLDSRDSSAVWATKFTGSLDANYVAPGAIEWLLLEVTAPEFGPTGGDRLAATGYIQRVHTVGGVKPSAGECTAATVNTRRLVSYEADYYFYR